MKETSSKSIPQAGNCPSYPSCPDGAQGAHLEKWYDNYEVMEMFHISQRTLQTLRSNGKLPFAKLGNKCYYREQDLQQMMMESFRDSRVKGGGTWQ